MQEERSARAAREDTNRPFDSANIEKCRAAKRNLRRLAFVAILLAAVGLRVYRLGAESLWFDEVVSFRVLDTSSLADYLRSVRAADPPMVPVYFVLQYYWARLVGDSVLTVRLLSVLAGILTVPLLYHFARKAYGPTAGLIAAFCMAVSRPHIYYSQEIRMYSVVTLLALASAYTFLEALRSKGRWWWALHYLTNVALVWTHLFAALVLLAQGCSLVVFHRRRPRRVVTWGVAHAVLIVPLMIWAGAIDFDKLDVAASWMTKPPLGNLAETILLWYPGLLVRRPDIFPWLIPPYILAGLSAFLIICLGVKTFLSYGKAKGRESAEKARNCIEIYVYLLAWLVIPPLALFILSYVYQPCFVDRYLLFGIPAFCVIVAGAFSTLRDRRWRVVAGCLLVALYGYYLVGLVRPFRPDYQSAAAMIESKGTQEDVVLTSPQGGAPVLRLYCSLPGKRIQGAKSPNELAPQAAQAVRGGSNTWVIVWEKPPEFPEDLEALLRSHQLLFTRKVFRGYQRLIVYHISPKMTYRNDTPLGGKRT